MIATVDISHWHEGGTAADRVAAAVDEGLQRAGFILVTGHGIDPDLARGVRAAGREFFSLPDDVKQQYSPHVGGEPEPVDLGVAGRRFGTQAVALLEVGRRLGALGVGIGLDSGCEPATPSHWNRRLDAISVG